MRIKLGLDDAPLQKFKEKIIEPGTDTRNDYTNWNVSVEVNGREYKKRVEELYLYIIWKFLINLQDNQIFIEDSET